MGGAVSSGRDNNELTDNLMGGNYIRTRTVERVFRVLDRADYMTPESRDQAYKDLAWRNGPLHMSAPCIYSEVLEGLELKPGLSFLNIGSGTGYFSTLVGLIIGSGGINHGIEVNPYIMEYAVKKLGQFIENSPTLDEFDFCDPKFYCANGLCLAPLQTPYDRVYCGAGCPEEYENYLKQLIKVGGILVMPLNDNLVQVKRTAVDAWSSRSMLNVSFATLIAPTKEEKADIIKLEEQCPPRLQILCRAVVRSSMRSALLSKNPQLREPPRRRPQPASSCPRRICIPIEDDSDVEGLNALHDLDHVNGANEMNALLSLVLSMGQNRVAGALRFDSLDSPSDSSADEGDGDGDADDGDGDDGDDGDDGPDRQLPERLLNAERLPIAMRTPRGVARPDRPSRPAPSDPPSQSDDCSKPARSCRGLLTFEFQEHRHLDGTLCQGLHGTSDESSKTVSDTKEPDVKVPAEVEIYLGKEAPSTSRDMHWEESFTEQKQDSSSEEETTETSKDQKRKKLDSGIGEGTTTSSGSSPAKSESIVCDESDADALRSDNIPNENVVDEELVDAVYSFQSGSIGRLDQLTPQHLKDLAVPGETARRRLQKRGRCAMEPQSSSSTECDGSGADDERRRRSKRRAADSERARDVLRPRRGGPDARRVRLSVLMKRGVRELPLPYALKKYVNLGRCFEF